MSFLGLFWLVDNVEFRAQNGASLAQQLPGFSDFEKITIMLFLDTCDL